MGKSSKGENDMKNKVLYCVEYMDDDVLCIAGDVSDSSDYDLAWQYFCELRDAETRADFEDVMFEHGANERGRGYMYGIELQGFYAEYDGDRCFYNINGLEHEVVNPDFIPIKPKF